jgi:hypothetical protein
MRKFDILANTLSERAELALHRATYGLWQNQDEVFCRIGEARRSSVAEKLLNILLKNGA